MDGCCAFDIARNYPNMLKTTQRYITDVKVQTIYYNSQLNKKVFSDLAQTTDITAFDGLKKAWQLTKAFVFCNYRSFKLQQKIQYFSPIFID